MKNRPIKFRVWDKKEKRILGVFGFGDLYGHSVGNVTFLFDGKDVDNHDFVFMQYTGLLDKDGKEIYEGDVVRFYDRVWRVDFEMAAFTLIGLSEHRNPDGSQFTNSDDLLGNYFKVLEVIGNIYENPELLGKL